jgi:hypothetical protein
LVCAKEVIVNFPQLSEHEQLLQRLAEEVRIASVLRQRSPRPPQEVIVKVEEKIDRLRKKLGWVRYEGCAL